MAAKPYQITGIGNAIIDIIIREDDGFLLTHNIEKGAMQLVERPHMRALLRASNQSAAPRKSGGSAANTIAAIARLGGRAAYIGKVKDDELGNSFSHNIQKLGVHYETKKANKDGDDDTGCSLIIVTPDGERSMRTYLGASETLSVDDIAPQLMAQSAWVYLEGYRFDGAQSHAAFAKAIRLCRGAGGKVALTLSDSFCVERHHRAFNEIIDAHIDLLFCNHAEILALCDTDDFATARRNIAQRVEILACTDGANGAYIIAEGREFHVAAEKIAVVDTTGAGDLFAAGFLYGLGAGHGFEECAKIGCAIAGQCVAEIGAHPKADLRALLVRKGLID